MYDYRRLCRRLLTVLLVAKIFDLKLYQNKHNISSKGVKGGVTNRGVFAVVNDRRSSIGKIFVTSVRRDRSV